MSNRPCQTHTAPNKARAPSAKSRHRSNNFSPSQRLCCGSSGLPWLTVSQDGVENGEELAHAGDHHDHLGLAFREQTLAKGADDRVVTNRGHGGDKEGGADLWPAAADEGFALPAPRLAREGHDADETADLAAIESAELGSSAMSVRAVISPTLGTEARRSSFSRQAGEPRTVSSIS